MIKDHPQADSATFVSEGAAVPEPIAPATQSGDGSPDAAQVPSPCVLLVDDQEMNIAATKHMLAPLGLTYITATSGHEALELLRDPAVAADVCLVLLDVMMPGMDGFQLAGAIREELALPVPVMFISAISTAEESILHGYEVGGVDYVVKPVSPQILRAKVRTLLELNANRKELTEAKRTLEKTVQKLIRSRQALISSEERYRIIADYSYDWEVWIGTDGQALYVSLSCERISGYPPEAFMAEPELMERIIHYEDLPAYKAYMSLQSWEGEPPLDFRFFRKDGRSRWLSMVCRRARSSTGEDLGVRASLRDITPRKHMENELRYQALHDSLTGLANRTLCMDRIKQALERAKRRDDYLFAVVFLDLDRFKMINDSLGHNAGDKLLEEVGERLERATRDLDTVARFGGDEFVILLEELESPRHAYRIVQRMREVLGERLELLGHRVKVSGSFGLVVDGQNFHKAEDILQSADVALHRAKESGRDRIKVFTSKLLDKAVHRMTLESDLRHAIEGEEFFVLYQPILNLKDMHLIGFEALVRWEKPGFGVVGPGEFIPVAEETGLIVDIGRFVLQKACATMAAWHAAIPGAEKLMLSVNVSGRQFLQSGMVEDVRRALSESGLAPGNLKLEITETAMMERAESAVEMLLRLKQLGVMLSIDDFGTGYSSMSYLQQFPLDHLKIDLTFIRNMHESPENLEIVKGIISLAHSLKLKVIAEGVESAVQQEMLSSLACEYGQGYLYSRPISETEAETFIRQFSSRPFSCDPA